MRDDIEERLHRLASGLSRSLDTLETDVFAAIAATTRESAAGRAVGTWSVAAALALGLAGGSTLATLSSPAQAAALIGIDTPLAPSTLLLGQ